MQTVEAPTIQAGSAVYVPVVTFPLPDFKQSQVRPVVTAWTVVAVRRG